MVRILIKDFNRRHVPSKNALGLKGDMDSKTKQGFAVLSNQVFQLCESFKLGFRLPQTRDEVIAINNYIAQTIFSKWIFDILLLLSVSRPLRFEEVRRSLGGISGKVLSRKLTYLERENLVVRGVTATRPPRSLYQLSEDGIVVVRLGEPVLMYLRLRT